MQIQLAKDPNFVAYYVELDLEPGPPERGRPGVDRFRESELRVLRPTFLFRLAEQTGVVLLNGGGSRRAGVVDTRLAGEPSCAVQYEEIGKAMIAAAEQYAAEYKTAKSRS